MFLYAMWQAYKEEREARLYISEHGLAKYLDNIKKQ